MLKVTPKAFKGEIAVPPSKSVSHRALICACLAEGTSVLDNVLMSEDIIATKEAIGAFGAHVEIQVIDAQKKIVRLRVKGTGGRLERPKSTLWCNESGSTLRFLIPFGGLIEGEICFDGGGRLPLRPLDPYFDLFDASGIAYKTPEGRSLPLSVKGKWISGTYPLPGDVSSQFVSGLLYVLPLLKGCSTVRITSQLESKAYVDMTLAEMKRFGVVVEETATDYVVQGSQVYRACQTSIEGDYSQGAFWFVASLLGEGVACSQLSEHSAQGDRVIVDIIRKMGGHISYRENKWFAEPGATHGTLIDVTQCPDLVPILAVLGALSEGTTRIVGAKRLRIKESDRLKAMAESLNAVGGNVQEMPEGLVIEGVRQLRGGVVDSFGDHRIAMAMAVASSRCQNPIFIKNPMAVTKSYPHFYEDFKSLGGQLQWVQPGAITSE